MKIDECFEKERGSQKLIDQFYKYQGWNYDRSGSCETYDVIIEEAKVEEKFRYEDYGDFLIEVMQDVISCNMGWYYKTHAERIFYIIKDKTLYSIDWFYFKKWLKNNYSNLRITGRISVQGYGLTVNIAIKWLDIPRDLYKTFDIDIGQLNLLYS